MSDTKELKKIKKKYGEKFKNLCRDLFPIIIEEEGTLLSILEKRFADNCNSLYEAITENGLEVDFKEDIFSEFDFKREDILTEETRTPYEILDEAGYDLIECRTEEEIQSFRKYYAPNELICTIKNGGRLKQRDCFFAVRKDVDKINREDFKKPSREDEYSTSVLGIQFTRKDISTVELISRYNHTVMNPNATLGNNLNRLASGLSQSFGNLLKERGLELSTENKEKFSIPGYTLASDGRYYKYNMEIDGEYYCPGNIVISNGVARSVGDPEKGLLIDNFYLDLENKTIKDMTVQSNSQYEQTAYKDSFMDGLQNIEKIEVKKIKEKDINKVIKLYIKDIKEPVIIEIDRDNQIVGYENHNLFSVKDYFLLNNRGLRKLNLPNLQEVGYGFLGYNEMLTELDLPSLQKVGFYFLNRNRILKSLKLPNLREARHGFLRSNEDLTEVELINLERVGSEFLYRNEVLTKLKLPNLQEAGDCFLNKNIGLTELELPNLRKVGHCFLAANKEIRELRLPMLYGAGHDFLRSNEGLIRVELADLTEVGDGFLLANTELREIKLPSLRETGYNFLGRNKELRELELPNLREVRDDFLCENKVLMRLSLPNLREVGYNFFKCNEGLKILELPNLQKVEGAFFMKNRSFIRVSIPMIPDLEESFREIIEKNIEKSDRTLIDEINEKREIIKEQEEEIKTLQEKRDKNVLKEPW